MKKHFLILFIFFLFFFSPIIVKADFGDLRYEVTDVDLRGSKITFKGWAYIHKTNNFVSVDTKQGAKNNGGQKILIRAVDSNGKEIETKIVSGSDKINYNFYCELFFKVKGKISCKEKYYVDYDYNDCSGSDNGASQCYYEDMYFEISFDVSKWNVKNLNDIKFKIAVSNSFFENKTKFGVQKYTKGNKIGKDYYTEFEDLSIAYAAASNNSTDYISINKDSVTPNVEFIASYGILRSPTDVSKLYKNGVYGIWNKKNLSAYKKYGNVYELLIDDTIYPNGRSKFASNELCYDFLGDNCERTYYYAIKVNKKDYSIGSGYSYAIPCKGSNCSIAIARGSHVKPVGVFMINLKNDKKCEVTNPLPKNLNCNSSGTLSSTCKELTINTLDGSAVVKIEQNGIVTNILTPDSIYAGGGFKFGIMYYNNIKWSYVGKKPGNKLHAAVTEIMNNKIKDYNSYIAGIKITNLKLGDNSITSEMVKKCTGSSTTKNYYGSNGITVSCVFTFPDSTIDNNGNVKYTSVSSSSLNINNKYYTPIDMNGRFSISATIEGMDRITETSAKKDSKIGKSWTGTWKDSIDGCEINLYKLFYKDNGKYNFIYRPIDIYNPFPNRNAGINWFDWYNINRNKERLEESYSNLQYIANLDNKNISEIKEYNKDNNYLNWDSINEKTGESSFITENDYIDRVGGN